MVRPFNIIGAGMPAHLAVQSFARQIIDGPGGSTRHPKVLKVGNLNSARDFLDIGEVTKLYWKLIQTPQAYGEIINVCSGIGINMGTLLDKLIAMSGASIKVEVDPARFKPVDIPVHYGSTVKLAGLAGYVPQLDLAASLKAILENLVKE
jgi:GDP-4-dehydro-6-deoxy-D-mannose reductase